MHIKPISRYKSIHFVDVIQVNNAGIQVSGSILNTAMSLYDRQMNVNVRSVYNLTMLAAPHLIKTKGNIVNVSSCAGIRAVSQLLYKILVNSDGPINLIIWDYGQHI